jgi:hypothetical protein
MAAHSYSYSMPIRSYVLVIGPALLAGLWFIGSALDPTPARQPGAPEPARAAKATLASPAQAAPTPAVPAPAPSPRAAHDAAAPSPQVRDQAPAEAAKAASGTQPLAPALEPAAPTASSFADEAPSRVTHAAKHKKRKQLARRRQHQDSDSPVYTERGVYPGYSARYSYDYGSPSPFSGFRTW